MLAKLVAILMIFGSNIINNSSVTSLMYVSAYGLSIGLPYTVSLTYSSVPFFLSLSVNFFKNYFLLGSPFFICLNKSTFMSLIPNYSKYPVSRILNCVPIDYKRVRIPYLTPLRVFDITTYKIFNLKFTRM